MVWLAQALSAHTHGALMATEHGYSVAVLIIHFTTVFHVLWRLHCFHGLTVAGMIVVFRRSPRKGEFFKSSTPPRQSRCADWLV